MVPAKNALLLSQARKAYTDGRYRAAQAQCEQILSGRNNDPDALQLLGRVFLAQYRFDDAVRCLQRCAAARPKRIAVQLALGHALRQRGSYGPALDRYDKALKLDRDSHEAVLGKAQVFHAKADHAKAIALLEPHLSAGTGNATMALIAARCLAALDRTDEAIDLTERYGDAADTSPATRRQLLFQQGSLLERKGDYDAAFGVYALANTVAPGHYDPDADRARIDDLIDVFSADNLARLPRATHGLDRPVLIVGMPRCGSTLLERVLAAHPRVAGAGEGLSLHSVLEGLSESIGSHAPYPRCVLEMSEAAMNEAGLAYVDGLARRAGGRPVRLIDKSLLNFEHLGFVTCIAPEARVIDCRRDPLDTCFSCFSSALPSAGHGYASSLAHVGQRYCQYARLMDHWHRVLRGDRLLKVGYEELTADLESTARRVLEFLEMPWDARCLRFHETKAAVRTISIDQVRKPIYRTSVARSQHFAGHLGELRQALAGDS